MPRALLLLAAAALTAGTLAACTPAPVAAPTTAPTAEPAPTDDFLGPTVDPAASCLDSALISSGTGVNVTTTGTTSPLPGPADGALAGVPRELCTYDLEGGSRIGFSPLVVTPDVQAMDAALASVVQLDDCAQVSGYLVTGQDTYFVWTGGSFASFHILAGDPTDPEVWLAKIADAAGLCGTGGDSL